MKALLQKFLKTKKGRWIGAALLLVALGSGVTLTLRSQAASTQSGQQTTAVQTAVVSRGDLSSSITGTGKLVSENVVSLAFPTKGKVEVLNARVGEQVKQGAVLAGLEKTQELLLAVENKQLALQTAEKAIQDLKDNRETALAQALADQASAGKAFDTAQIDLIKKGQPRCDKNVTEQYYYDYMYAKHDYTLWHSYLVDGGTGYGTMYIQERMAPYQKAMQTNYANWKYCEGYTDLEKQTSEAALQLAKANLDKAKSAYDDLVKNGGVDPLAMNIAEATRDDAQRQLSQAQENLTDATLIAPFDGVITKVNGIAGQTVDTGEFIQMADLKNVLIQTSIDETDVQDFETGCDAAVTFTSYPDQTFKGTVTRVDPALAGNSNSSTTESNDSSTAQGMVKLAESLPESLKEFSLGLDASVQITCSQAKNVLLAPVSALHKNLLGQYTVTVLGQNGKQTQRGVEVGLSNSVIAEIRGGLKEGESVVIEQGSSK